MQVKKDYTREQIVEVARTGTLALQKCMED